MRQARGSGLALLLNLITGLSTAILVIFQSYLIADVISRVFMGKETLEQVTFPLTIIAGLIIVRALLVLANDVSAKTMAIHIKTNLRKMILEKVSRLGPVYLAGENRGRLLNISFTGIESLDAYFSQYLPQVFLSGLIPLTILIAVFPREPLTGFILLTTAPLIPLFMALIGIMTEQRTKKQWEFLTRLSSRFYESLRGLEFLKQINKQDDQANVISQSDREYRKATMNVLQFTFLSAMVLELVATISTAIVAVEIGLRLLYGRIEFQPALFLLILAPEFYLPLRQLGVKYHAAMSGIQAAGDIFQFLQVKEASESLPFDQIQNRQPSRSQTSIFPIEMNKVSVSYPDSLHSSLEDINLTITEGMHLALVGPSGAGKTTIIYLLLRFLIPSSGSITANGDLLQEWNRADWLEKISWVPQTPHLFSGTIAENVTFSATNPDSNRLVHAIQSAGLMDWLDTLPRGWESHIGELSSGISTGQAQRIAIARAFYKDAPLLIMDEPTSAVDPIMESSLLESTRELMRTRTTITIAHRLPTIYQSDQILMLKTGRIVEQGDHNSLVKLGGLYFDFFREYHNDH